MLKFKKIIFAAVFALSLFNFGCSNDSDITSFSETVDSSKNNSDFSSKGLGVKVVLPTFGNDASENSRSVAYRLSETKSFRLTVIKSEVITDTKTANLPCSSMEVTLTDFGTYTIKLDALDASGTELGSGTENVTFSKGETENKEITINVQANNRTTNLGVKLNATWPEVENCYKVSDATYFYVNIKNIDTDTIVYAAEISDPTKGVQILLGTYGKHSVKVVATNKYGFIVGKGETVNFALSDETDYKVVDITVTGGSYPIRTEGYTGKTVEFGEWPQSVKIFADGEEEPTKTTGRTFDGYPEYEGTDGKLYVKVTATNTKDRTLTDGDKPITLVKNKNNTCWFKVEPIVWKVAALYSDGSKILLADRIVLAGYNQLGSKNFENSNGRQYLNSTDGYAAKDAANKGFYSVAFNDEQKGNFVSNTLTANSFGDNVTLLTKSEVEDTNFVFKDQASRKNTPTDYVLSQNGNSNWWTSTDASRAFVINEVYYVKDVGSIDDSGYGDTTIGYVPVIVIAN